MSVLVTGGSGTLGSEVCRQLANKGEAVVAMGRDRSRLMANCSAVAQETGDVRDRYRLKEICRRHEVLSIVHCAAIKHVGVCEEQPQQAVCTNLHGVENVLDVIRACGIRQACFVSSDKATDQTVYGITKYLGERLVMETAQQTGWNLNCVRPGNIIGSAGSVVDIWRRAHLRGEAIRLDGYEGKTARRFIMSPGQAAKLVRKALTGDYRGNVIACRMPTVDMETLAAAVVPEAKIERGPMPEEWLHQTVIGERESQYLLYGMDSFVLGRESNRSKQRNAYSTHNQQVLTLEATRDWLDGMDVLPLDPDRQLCS